MEYAMKLIVTFSSVAVCLLSPAAVSQTLLRSEFASTAHDAFGSSVAIVGDVNADGVNDYGVGAWSDDTGGTAAGMVRIYSGASGAPLYTYFGNAANERMGWVSGAGDLDSDGSADFMVGAPGGNYVNVHSGATGSVLYQLTGNAGDFFGVFMASGGHVDADGINDLLIGAPFAGAGGQLHVYSGATGGLIRTHSGTCSGYLGQSAAFYGDVDGDGVDEYAVGRPIPNSGCGSPEVLAFDGATGTQLWNNSGFLCTDELGWAIEPIEDVTGDGIMDLLAGAPQDPGVGCGPCNGRGYVRLLNGATGATVWQVDGASSYSGLGTDITIVGDLNADGFDDFAVSQPSSEGCGGNTQAVQVRDGVTGAFLFSIPSIASNDNFGASMASGDANGGGLRDLLVGVPCDSTGATYAGATYLYTIVRGVVTYCEGKLNSQGCIPTIFAAGSPSFSVPTFRIRAFNEVNNKFGLLFWGRKPTMVPFQGGSLCIAGQLNRTDVQNSGGNPPPNDCSGRYAFHFSGVFMNSVGITAGEQIYAQYWSRDPGAPFGTGLSDAIAFHVLP